MSSYAGKAELPLHLRTSKFDPTETWDFGGRHRRHRLGISQHFGSVVPKPVAERVARSRGRRSIKITS